MIREEEEVAITTDFRRIDKKTNTGRTSSYQAEKTVDGEEFYKSAELENQIESTSIAKRDENDPHVKYNKWKKQITKEENEEKTRYDCVLTNLEMRNHLDSFKKQNCSFQCLIDISKRQKGKDFYICCYKECSDQKIICRECAQSCHKPVHLKTEKEYLQNIIKYYDKVKKKHEMFLNQLDEDNKKIKEGKLDKAIDVELMIQNYKNEKKEKNGYNEMDDYLAEEFNLAYEYEKFNCEKEKLEVESKNEKFLENYVLKNLKMYKISHKMNYELICQCGDRGENSSHKVKNEKYDFKKRNEKSNLCTFTEFFSNTKKSTNFYIFERFESLIECKTFEGNGIHYDDREQEKNRERIALSRYIEERKMADEKRKLLTTEGKAKFDKRQKYVLTVDKLVTDKNNSNQKMYCAFCVDNCIMPHFEFKKNPEDIPVAISIDKLKEENKIKDDMIKCHCNQHEEYFDFDYRDNINEYSLNFNFNVLFNDEKNKNSEKPLYNDNIEKYLQNYDEVDFNNAFFLHSLEVFRIFDLYYNSKYFLPNHNFLKNLNIRDPKDDKKLLHIAETDPRKYIDSETRKIIDAYCMELGTSSEKKKNEVNFNNMNRSFSSKIIFLYMIFYKTTKTLVVQKFAHFCINSIVNMTVPQRYLYIYRNHKFMFKEHLETPEFEIFKSQFFLFVEIFLSYMEQDIYANYDDMDNDNYSLIHKIFKLIFKFNFSKMYNKKGEIEKKNIFDGKPVQYLLEKKYLDIVHKVYLNNKSVQKRCLSESSYYILKSIFYIIYRLNDESYEKILSKGEFNSKEYEKVFFKGEISDAICKVTLMCLDNYDSTKNPERSLKFQLYSKYILDVIIDKNKNYNIGINNLHYLRDSSFDVFLNPTAITNYINSDNNKKVTVILNLIENNNWKYNKNEIDYNTYVRLCTDPLTDLVNLAKETLKLESWNIDFLFQDKIKIYTQLGNLFNDGDSNGKNQGFGRLYDLHKMIKFNKFISVMDCFISNYSEANMKDIRKSKCSEKLPIELRRDLLVLFMALIFEDPENFNLIMSIDGKCFTYLFLERYDREQFNGIFQFFENKWQKKEEEEKRDNTVIDNKQKLARERALVQEQEMEKEYRNIINENLSIECYLKFLSVISDIICSSRYQFINLKFFTDSMTETCKFIDIFRNNELELLDLLKQKHTSHPEEINLINNKIEKKYQFLQLYLNHYKDTIGKSQEENDIYEKYKECTEIEDEERRIDYLRYMKRIYDQEIIDILLRNSVAKITSYLGKFLKVFSKIFKHLTLLKTECLDCLEHVVTIVKKCSTEEKIFTFSIEKFVKNRIPLYEKDAIEVFMKYYLKFFCRVFYNSLSFMRIFKYDVITGGIFNALKKDYVIPEKLPLTLQMEIVKFTFSQIEIDFDLQQPIEQDIPFKSEYFWMAQKKPRFLYEVDDKRKFNPKLALTFALKSIKYCQNYIIDDTKDKKVYFKNNENLWRRKYYDNIEEYEKKREKIMYKDEQGREPEDNFYLKKDKNEKKMYRNCIRFFQNCCLKSMYFLTCFEEIYNLYENHEMRAVVEIVTTFVDTAKELYSKILTKENYEKHFKDKSNRFIRKVYFDKIEYFVKFFLTSEEFESFEKIIDKNEKMKMKNFYFKMDENTRKGRKLLQFFLKYKPYPIVSSTFDVVAEEKLRTFYDDQRIINFLIKDLRKMDKFDKKIENSKLSLILVFENNEENIPLYNIFLDIVLKNLFSKVSYFKLSNKAERFKVNYYTDQKTFKMCYEDLEWHNSIYLYFLNIVFSYNSNIFQLGFYSKLSQEKEIWNDFLIFLICFYCWNLSLHAVMRTRDLLDLRVKSNFIIDLNFSSIKILQNLCEGHNKTFQDFLFNFEFDVKQVKDLFWGKNIYITREEIDKKMKYKIFNFINCNQHNLFKSLKRRIYPKDKGVLSIMQKYIDLIIEMIQGTSMSNLKNVTNRLRFLDERTKFESEYHYDDVKKNFMMLKKMDAKLTDKRFFKKNNFHKNDNLNDKKLVKQISLEKYLKKIDLYEPEYFDFYTFINDIKQYLVNDYYLVDELVIRLQTCMFEYINNILKSDIDQDWKNGVEVFTKFFKVEEIIVLLMKYFIMIKYKYLHNSRFSTGKEPKYDIYNENEITVSNFHPHEKIDPKEKKKYPEPKIIDLDEVFLTEEEIKQLSEIKLKASPESLTISEKELLLKEKFKNVNFPEYKRMMRIYKQKTGPLYYHMGRDVNIYDDPVFQTSCKLVIYLKILAYKYQNTEAQKVLELNLTPYINQQMSIYKSDGTKKEEVKKNKNDDEEEQNEDENDNEEFEDIKKLNKNIKEIFDQYNFNYVSKTKDHKYLPEINYEDYKDTLIYCLQFFNKVIKSCEFVLPINMFEEIKLVQKASIKEEIVDSEDDKDEEEEEEEYDEDRKMDEIEEEKKKKIEGKKSNQDKKVSEVSNFNKSKTELVDSLHRTITLQTDEEENDLNQNSDKNNDIDEKLLDILDDDSDKEERQKKKKKKTELNKKEKDEDEDENDEDWEIEKRKKEEYEKEIEEEKNKDMFNHMKFEREIQEKKESSKQLKKLHYIFDPKYYYKISRENINEFYENDADRSSSNNKISSLLETIDKFIIEIEFKNSNEGFESSLLMKNFFEKKMYKNINIINFFTSLFAVCYLFIFLDQMNYETIRIYYFIYGPLFLLIILNSFTILMFLKAKYPYFKSIELKKLYEGENEDFKPALLDEFSAKFLNSFLLHNDIIFLIMNLITSIIMLFRPNYIFLFCFQLTTIINFYPKVEEIFMAFSSKITQLLAMIIFLAILIYVYAFIGFFYLQGEFDVDTDSGYQENLCSSMIQCAITYFNHGVRSGGGIGDILAMRSFTEPKLYTARYVSDMIFYITVILLLLNMVNGVIVTTFSQIRQERETKEEDKENKCFICSINRVEFEKRKISFEDHNNKEHSYKTYIKYLLHLKYKNEDEMDYDESHIYKSVEKKDVGCFPIKRAFSIGRGNEVKDEEEEN